MTASSWDLADDLLDELDDPTPDPDDDEPLDWSNHPSLTAAERNPSLR